MKDSLLTIDHLDVGYKVGGNWLDAVHDVSLRVEAGQVYGIVGESGSGKSTLALAVMRYLGENGEIRGGTITLDGADLTSKTTAELRELWGGQIGLVPQDPMASLNPSLPVGEQIAEIARRHGGLNRADSELRAVAMLASVRVPDPADVARRYPHQLSGGMQQRVVIAMALVANPRLLVLDEPTTNLDVTTEAVVLDLFAELLAEYHSATLFVTHNLGLIARMCDRVGVMYAGELMEDADMRGLFKMPLHPYTIGLINCIPKPGANKRETVLKTIPGQIPALADRPMACVFADRCPAALDVCRTVKPPLESAGDGRFVRCHRWREIAAGELRVFDFDGQPVAVSAASALEPDQDLLTIADLKVQFGRGNAVERLIDPDKRAPVKAVDGVTLTIQRGQTLGLVGESGSGKTTLARSVVGLVDVGTGQIDLPDASLNQAAEMRPHQTLRRLQMVFQNPEESLNPYHTVGDALRRPLITLAGKTHAEADTLALELLNAVHLPQNYAERLPSELSGGEKQRIAIARAFAAQPDLIVCDEPVSALDVSVQASILNLLAELQRERGTSYLFISHDLAVVGYLADRIAVIYLGQIVEVSDAEGFFRAPHHPYTEALLSAIPVADPDGQRARIRLEGDPPSAVNPPCGCRFHTRCPRFLGEICETVEPPWQADGNGRQYRCHIPPDELARLQGQGG